MLLHLHLYDNAGVHLYDYARLTYAIEVDRQSAEYVAYRCRLAYSIHVSYALRTRDKTKAIHEHYETNKQNQF